MPDEQQDITPGMCVRIRAPGAPNMVVCSTDATTAGVVWFNSSDELQSARIEKAALDIVEFEGDDE